MCSIGSNSTAGVGATSAGAIGGGSSIGGGAAGGSTILGARRVVGGSPTTSILGGTSPAPARNPGDPAPRPGQRPY